MADKKEFHLFLLPEYEEEEKYLNKMAKKGYRLEKITLPGIYSFTKTEPEDMIYRIDFNPQKKEDLAGYHQMFADYGWEYLQDMNEYSYFRKPADVRDEDADSDHDICRNENTDSNNDICRNEDIYSDNDSRLDMIKRILRTKMLPFMILFLGIVIPQFVGAIFHGSMGPAGRTILIMWTVVLVLYIYIFVRCYVGFKRLKKKYESEM